MRTERFASLLVAFALTTPLLAVDPGPDQIEPGSVEEIRRYTTDSRYLPESVAYVPESATVPSPKDHHGRLSGTPRELSTVAEVHGYFRALAAASPRVQAEVIGESEEGREILLVRISSEENLADLERLTSITERLADPREIDAETAAELIATGKPFYYLTGGLHSPETGSPEMLMELGYRLAVSEKPEIDQIRRNLVTLITPVAEPDGRDRMVEWYYRHLRDREGSFRELRQIGGPPYWGKYAFHDNNRDGMQLTLALTRAINDAWWEHHPQIFHDLHESLPLLYISTGHGPYSDAIDALSVNEWTQFAHNEAAQLQAMGLPGVWVWGFWDGWWPGYLFSVANNHNSIGRFYETFGNALAGTFTRELDEIEFVGKPVTTEQWYRPDPPDEEVVWSLRNNTNYMQAGVLEALQFAASRPQTMLRNYRVKHLRSLEQGRSEAPYAFVFPDEQRDRGRLEYLINQLGKHRIEVHRLEEEWSEGELTFEEGAWVVRMDQPYRNGALNFLGVQEFPEDEVNRPYDDVAWTWPLLYGVESTRVDDGSILDASMSMVDGPVDFEGEVEGRGGVFIVKDTGQNALLDAILALGPARVEIAEHSFDIGDESYPAGSLILSGSRAAMNDLARMTGLDVEVVRRRPQVETHRAEMPRLAVLHGWSTQDAGWVRYLFDQEGIDYTLINPDDVRNGRLGSRFDVIVVPNRWGGLDSQIHGSDTKLGPIAYTRTEEYPSHGYPDSSPDVTRGVEFQGLANLQEFIEEGGVVVAIENGATLFVDSGIVRDASRMGSSVYLPGSEVQAKALSLDSPILYGYEELPTIFRGNGPVFDVSDTDRDLVVLQFGTKVVEPAEEHFDLSPPPEDFEVEGAAALKTDEPADEETEESDDGEEKKPFVLSGYKASKGELDGKPAILNIPVGEGRVVIFNFNPMHRYLNHSDFRFIYNTLLNWRHLD